MENETKVDKWIVLGVIAFLAIILLFSSVGTVGAGERGVKTRFGAVTGDTVQPGLYFKTPFVEGVDTIDVQTQVENVEATAASKDLQNVTANIGLNYSVNEAEVVPLYRDTGADYKTKIIDPAIQDAVKAATANYTAEELITKREDVKNAIVEILKTKFVGQHLNIVSLNITNFQFSASFEQAIEAKVTAEQNALAAKNKLDQVKYEAEQRVAEADGEAKAIAIQAQAITSQGGAEYVKLQWIKAWSDGGAKVPQVINGGTGNGFLLNLDLAK